MYQEQDLGDLLCIAALQLEVLIPGQLCLCLLPEVIHPYGACLRPCRLLYVCLLQRLLSWAPICLHELDQAPLQYCTGCLNYI